MDLGFLFSVSVYFGAAVNRRCLAGSEGKRFPGTDILLGNHLVPFVLADRGA